MDSLRGEFAVVERRWSKIKTESEEWGKLLESIHPEMETFQVCKCWVLNSPVSMGQGTRLPLCMLAGQGSKSYISNLSQ